MLAAEAPAPGIQGFSAMGDARLAWSRRDIVVGDVIEDIEVTATRRFRVTNVTLDEYGIPRLKGREMHPGGKESEKIRIEGLLSETSKAQAKSLRLFRDSERVVRDPMIQIGPREISVTTRGDTSGVIELQGMSAAEKARTVEWIRSKGLGVSIDGVESADATMLVWGKGSAFDALKDRVMSTDPVVSRALRKMAREGLRLEGTAIHDVRGPFPTLSDYNPKTRAIVIPSDLLSALSVEKPSADLVRMIGELLDHELRHVVQLKLLEEVGAARAALSSGRTTLVAKEHAAALLKDEFVFAMDEAGAVFPEVLKGRDLAKLGKRARADLALNVMEKVQQSVRNLPPEDLQRLHEFIRQALAEGRDPMTYYRVWLRQLGREHPGGGVTPLVATVKQPLPAAEADRVLAADPTEPTSWLATRQRNHPDFSSGFLGRLWARLSGKWEPPPEMLYPAGTRVHAKLPNQNFDTNLISTGSVGEGRELRFYDPRGNRFFSAAELKGIRVQAAEEPVAFMERLDGATLHEGDVVEMGGVTPGSSARYYRVERNTSDEYRLSIGGDGQENPSAPVFHEIIDNLDPRATPTLSSFDFRRTASAGRPGRDHLRVLSPFERGVVEYQGVSGLQELRDLDARLRVFARADGADPVLVAGGREFRVGDRLQWKGNPAELKEFSSKDGRITFEASLPETGRVSLTFKAREFEEDLGGAFQVAENRAVPGVAVPGPSAEALDRAAAAQRGGTAAIKSFQDVLQAKGLDRVVHGTTLELTPRTGPSFRVRVLFHNQRVHFQYMAPGSDPARAVFVSWEHDVLPALDQGAVRMTDS
jgi:hypothetical protein